MSAPFKTLALGSCLFLAACDPGKSTELPNPGGATKGGTDSSAPQGTDTGAPKEPGLTPSQVPHCKAIKQTLPNADTPVGSLIPRELALKATTKTRGLWVEQSNKSAAFVIQSIQPSANNEKGEIEVSYTEGPVRFIKNEYVGCDPNVACADIAVICVDSIEIDLQVSMRSDNGVFAESWTGTLTVPDPRDPDHKAMEPGGGSSESETGPLTNFSIRANIDPIAFSGSASLQTKLAQPGFKITKNQVRYALNYKDGKFAGAELSSSTNVIQDPLPKDGSGLAGGDNQLLYSFKPGT